MIKTDWVKCDNMECQKVAWFIMKDTTYQFQTNVCHDHYRELMKDKRRDWEVTNIEGNYQT